MRRVQHDVHLSPAALDPAVRLPEQPAGPSQTGRGVQSFGDLGETEVRDEKRLMNPGGKLAVRQGFEF